MGAAVGRCVRAGVDGGRGGAAGAGAGAAVGGGRGGVQRDRGGAGAGPAGTCAQARAHMRRPDTGGGLCVRMGRGGLAPRASAATALGDGSVEQRPKQRHVRAILLHSPTPSTSSPCMGPFRAYAPSPVAGRRAGPWRGRRRSLRGSGAARSRRSWSSSPPRCAARDLGGYGSTVQRQDRASPAAAETRGGYRA